MLRVVFLCLLPVCLLAESPKIEAMVQFWGHQMQGDDLRANSPAWPYASLPTGSGENGFVVRRAEVWLTGDIGEGLSYTFMNDFALTGNGLLVAQGVWQRGAWEIRAGSFRALQTWEGMQRDYDLLLAERFQFARVFADKSDWGAVLGRSLPGQRWKVFLGVFNGGGRNTDRNSGKDLIARLQFKSGRHAAGIYGLRGGTDLPDKGLQAALFTGSEAPDADKVMKNDDRTANLGLYYVFERGAWYLHTEGVAGLWGRRYPSLTLTPGPATREHLDQRFLNTVITLARSWGRHSAILRWDRLDANLGDRWYGTSSPYQRAGSELPPVFTEATLGYRYALRPQAAREANLKVNWIRRSGFLSPLPGQRSAPGGNSLLVSVQVMQ